MNLSQSIRVNYQRVQERIAESAILSSRSPDDVKLITVTKGKSIETVQAAISAGARILGENYPEEGQTKILAASDQSSVQWHMIGHIQSRKARIVCENFNYVHSLDSMKLARRLDRFSGEMKNTLPVLLEINVSGEESKFGWRAHRMKDWAGLLTEFSEIVELPNLQVRGLMTIPPIVSDAEDSRPHFQLLRKLRDYLAIQLSNVNWSELSMGMSADFESAIKEGSTMVRIGTAILGAR